MNNNRVLEVQSDGAVVLPGVVAYRVAQSAEVLSTRNNHQTKRLLERVWEMKRTVETFSASRLPIDQSKNHSAYVEALLITLRLAHELGDQELVTRAYDRGVAWASDSPLIGADNSYQLREMMRFGKQVRKKVKPAFLSRIVEFLGGKN